MTRFSADQLQSWMDEAYLEAEQGLSEGGVPIGSVLVDPETSLVVSRGHNLLVQYGDPIAHAETAAIRNAGRRRDWHKLVLVSTLSPCIMCTGTALLYKIPYIIVGENTTFTSFAEEILRAGGDTKSVKEVVNLNDQRCIDIMTKFIEEKPDLWNEVLHENFVKN